MGEVAEQRALLEVSFDQGPPLLSSYFISVWPIPHIKIQICPLDSTREGFRSSGSPVFFLFLFPSETPSLLLCPHLFHLPLDYILLTFIQDLYFTENWVCPPDDNCTGRDLVVPEPIIEPPGIITMLPNVYYNVRIPPSFPPSCILSSSFCLIFMLIFHAHLVPRRPWRSESRPCSSSSSPPRLLQVPLSPSFGRLSSSSFSFQLRLPAAQS